MFKLASRKIIPRRLPGPDITVNTGRCQRTSRLPDISGLWILPHRHSEKPLSKRKAGSGTGSIIICPRFNNHRSMPLSISMGNLSKDQGSHKTPYTAGFARLNPHVHQPCTRQCPRCYHLGHSAYRTKINRHNGSRVHRLQTIICDSSTSCLFRHSCKEQSEVSPSDFTKGGQNFRSSGRPNNHSQSYKVERSIPGGLTASVICRPGNKQTLCFPDQYIYNTGRNSGRHLQTTLANRTVFQMDQTALENKIVLWNIIQSGKNPDLGCHQYLFAGSNYEKAA